MLYLYLAATIIGGTLLGASVVMGDHHGGGGGHGDVDHGADAHASDGHSSSSLGAILFSVRVWTYLLAFGGATGLILRLVAHTWEPLCAILAAAVGITAGLVARSVIGRMTENLLPGTVNTAELAGRTGQLLLPVGRGTSGTVRLTVQGSTRDLIATSDDEVVIPAREEVLIVEVRDGSALVTRSPLGTRKNNP